MGCVWSPRHPHAVSARCRPAPGWGGLLAQECQASGCPTGTAGAEDIQIDWITIDNPAWGLESLMYRRPVLPPRSCSMPLGTMNGGWTQSIAPEVEAAMRRLAAVAAMHARCISTTGAVSTVPCAVQQSVLATEDDGGVGRRDDGHRRGAGCLDAPVMARARAWRRRHRRSRSTPP
jgi:hypothetical protein